MPASQVAQQALIKTQPTPDSFNRASRTCEEDEGRSGARLAGLAGSGLWVLGVAARLRRVVGMWQWLLSVLVVLLGLHHASTRRCQSSACHSQVNLTHL